MKLFIGEDEILIAEYLKDTIESYDIEVLGMAHNKEDILKDVTSLQPDLVFLDIRMKGKTDGIEIGEHLFMELKIPFIYLTAHADKSIIEEAVKTKPIAYLIKPFQNAEIFSALSMAKVKLAEKESDDLLIKDGHTTVKLKKSNILYVKSEANYLEFYTTQQKYVVRSSFVALQKDLSTDNFMRVHRSYLVNFEFISHLNSNSLSIGKVQVPVSRKYQQEVKLKFAK